MSMLHPICLENQLFWYFYNKAFGLSEYIIFWQSKAINTKCIYKNKLCTTLLNSYIRSLAIVHIKIMNV